MQDIPDRNVLLQAVAGFLDQQVAPAIADRGLSFRVRIAAHLVMTVARECLLEEADDAAQLRRLQALLGARPGDVPIDPPADRDARQQAILSQEAELATRIREGALSQMEEVLLLEGLKATLAEKLRVVNPRFNLALDIEYGDIEHGDIE